MREICLTQGKVALVDDCDFEELNRFKWYAHKSHNTFYAQRKQPMGSGKRINVPMHRQILGSECDGKLVDHRNRDGLDNRRENLRVCTHAENMRNRQIHKISKTSPYRGVCWKGKGNQKHWYAYIRDGNKSIHLGVFDCPKEAARAHDAAAIKHYGEFACLNFPNT